MENNFYIKGDEFFKNRESGLEKCKGVGWISERLTFGGGKGTYITWTKVHLWMKKYYPNHKFDLLEIGDDYVLGELSICGEKLGKLSLTLETYFKAAHTDKWGKEHPEKTTKEKSEALQMRVYVKLVANITGFGFHLWDKGSSIVKKGVEDGK